MVWAALATYCLAQGVAGDPSTGDFAVASGGGGISFAAACTGINGTSAASTTAMTCSPANGTLFVLALETGASITAVSCKDNNSVSLTAGPTIINTTDLLLFEYVVTGSPTSFSCTWTTSRAWTLGGVNYTGVTTVNLTPTSATATGSSTSPSVSPVSTVTNDFMVAACGFATAKTFTTPKTGNERETVGTNGAQAIIDSTSGGSSGSGVTEADTVTAGGAWACAALELKP